MFFTHARKRLQELSDKLAGAYKKIEELEKDNSVMQSILSGMIEGVILADKDSRIISINPAIENIFKIKKQDAQGRLFLEAIRNNDIAEIIALIFSNKEALSREINLVWPLQKTFQVNAAPIFQKEKISGCLLVIHDITEIRKLETVRRDFVANVSHELKTPLTSIKGFVETLLEGAMHDQENARHFLEIIKNHANRLDSLVNDLLSLAYLESKEMISKKAQLNFKELVDDILAGFKAQLEEKALKVKNELVQGLSIVADKDKIAQVLTNLVDNAIKFNKENGNIRIYSQDLGPQVKFIVEDSGLGIPQKDIPRIFERFYRVDKARSREIGGTGLGLSIVKHIVELHGGTVGVESTEGIGSKFCFDLPK